MDLHSPLRQVLRIACSLRSEVTAVVLIGLISPVISGCGNSNLAPARGTLQIEGQLADGGRVVFRPMEGGETAIGRIQADGSFVMKVQQKKRGAQIGINHILVVDATVAGSDEEVSYRSPPEERVEVKAKTNNEFQIAVEQERGWKPVIDD